MNDLLIELLTHANGPLEGKRIKNISVITGGSTHQSWQIELSNGERIFAKTAAKKQLPMFTFEVNGLIALKKFSNPKLLTIPEPIGITSTDEITCLLIPWIEFNRSTQSFLGSGLAELHKTSSAHNPDSFGWNENGFLGGSPQLPGWDDNWGNCFTKLRLRPQIICAQKWGLNIDNIDLLLSFISEKIQRHNPTPSLVHGDLWGGNIAIDRKGRGVLFDPAVWWADREVDIAMTRLFGGFDKNFYTEYSKAWPLQKGSEEREDIYNLYHLLNHANLFGGTYKSESINIINKITQLMNI